MAAGRELPEGLYEALPLVYLVVGVLTIVELPGGMGMFSGLTLVSAALLVWRMRRKSRRAAQATVIGAFDSPTRPRMIQLSWSPALASGNPAIDEQHRRLFGIGNQIINAASSGRDKHQIEVLLDELIAAIEAHFCTEEALLARIHHPLLAEHQGVHRKLLARAHDLRDGYVAGRVVTGDLVGFMVYDLVNMHVLKEDVRLNSP